MRIAQQLYEGIDIKGNGTVGVITYLRTDSTRISEEADASAREYIGFCLWQRVLWRKAVLPRIRERKIQDAHEANPSNGHHQDAGGP